MKYSNVILKPDEKAVFSLRELYLKYGYLHYKVGKFEEYDLYAGNKSFLISDNILTFTDTNGRLMALKPDVTLSIVKNVGDGSATHKLFYNENVYRTSASSGGFREIMQTGLECIGSIDIYSTAEVLMLACESLSLMSTDSLLALSHMGYTLGLLEECELDSARTREALSYIESKNAQAISAMADLFDIEKDKKEALCFVATSYGELSSLLPKVEKYCFNERMSAAYSELCSIAAALPERKLYIDFSLVNDMNYYDGIIFKGYINGIPDSILSGGRYDKLVSKVGKSAGAIGFAVYLDLLERFEEESTEYDVDVLLVYGEDADAAKVAAEVSCLVAEGRTVKAASIDDGSVKYREKIALGGALK